MSTSKPWSAVNEHDIVEGKKETLWSVEKIDTNGEFTLMNVETGRIWTFTPEPAREVVVVVTATHALETAKALAVVHLGGQELGTLFGTNEQGEWICPPDYDHPGALMSHLLVHHSIYGKAVAGRSLVDLRALHAEVSKPEERAGGHVPHVHDPRYADIGKRRVEENA